MCWAEIYTYLITTGPEGKLKFFKSPGFPDPYSDGLHKEPILLTVSEGKHVKIIRLVAENLYLYQVDIDEFTKYNGAGVTIFPASSVNLIIYLPYGGRYAFTFVEI